MSNTKKIFARILLAALALVALVVLVGWFSGPLLMLVGAIAHGDPLAVIAALLLGLFVAWRLGILRIIKDWRTPPSK